MNARTTVTASRRALRWSFTCLCALVVWLAYGAAHRRAPEGAHWSSPLMLSPGLSPPGLLAWFPTILATPDGRIHVFWTSARRDAQEKTGGFDTVMHCTCVGDRCSTPAEILRFDWRGGVIVTRPAVAVDRLGQLHLLARSTAPGGGLERIYYSRARALDAHAPSAWSTPTPITRGPSSYSDIAIDERGTIHIVWSQRENANVTPGKAADCSRCSDIYYRRSPDGGRSWSEPRNITQSSLAAEKARLLLDGRGAIYLTWEEGRDFYGFQGQADSSGILISRDGGTTWSDRTMVRMPGDAPQRITSGLDLRQQVVVVWGLAKGPGIYYQISKDSGRTWSAAAVIPGLLARRLDSKLDHYHMAADSRGHLHLVAAGRLRESGPGGTMILHVEWDGERWSAPDAIAAYEGDVPEWPVIAIDSRGGLHAAWFVRDREHVWEPQHGLYRVWYAYHP